MLGERLRAVFSQVFAVDAAQLDDAASPESVAGWDSFGHLALVDALQSEFQVSFAVEDIARLESLGRIAQILVERGAQP